MEVTKATEFLLEMPADGGNYTIVASYDVEGENPICSTRYVVLSKGEGTVIPPEAEENPPVTEEYSFLFYGYMDLGRSYRLGSGCRSGSGHHHSPQK